MSPDHNRAPGSPAFLLQSSPLRTSCTRAFWAVLYSQDPGPGLTPTRWPTVTERPMESAGEPTPLRRLSVDAKMQAASWKVRMISTTRAWPGVTLVLIWNHDSDNN